MVLLPLIFISLLTKFSVAIDTLTPNQALRDAGQTLVSADQSFQLGFFSPPYSSNRYIGIWFKNIKQLTPVWVANKNSPIPDSSGILTLSRAGNIIVSDNRTNPIWSSNSSAANPVLQLLDSGNLVVRNGGIGDNSGTCAWQSFDYPCDTLIPGMRLGWNLQTNQEWYLTSWKSLQDPSSGEFTYRLDPWGLPQIVLRRGSEIQYRSGPWDGVLFGNGPPLRPNTVFWPIFVFNSSFVYYTFEKTDSTIVSRFVVNQSGFVQHLSWNQKRGEWVNIVTLQGDTCDDYKICGAYGVCKFGERANCHCFDGFRPKSPQDWSKMDWLDGCVPKAEAECGRAEGFRRFSRLKLPDNSSFLANGTKMSLVDCEAACLRNCKCVAYAKPDASGCVVWFGELIDVREYGEGGQDLYVRMAESQLGDLA